MSYKGLGKECTGTLRKWTLCAQELRAQVDPDPPVEHCAKFLKERISASFGKCWTAVAMQTPCFLRAFAKVPSSWVLCHLQVCCRRKNTFATLTPEEVRVNSASAREAIWNSCKGTTSDRVAQEVFRITKEEKDDGWLEGPF